MINVTVLTCPVCQNQSTVTFNHSDKWHVGKTFKATKQHSLCSVHFAKATHMNEVVTLGRSAFLEGSERFPHEATCTGMSRSLRGSLRRLVCMVCPVLWLSSNKSTNVRTPALIRHSSTTTQARSCGSQRSASHNPQGVHWSCPWCPFRHSCELSS